MEQIHTENPDKGYRRIKDDLAHDHKLYVNEKRVLRICRSLDIKSTIKYKNNGCTRQAANPQHIAKNWLNRQFHASMPNEKWLTDVTEFKYHIGPEVHKVYLSAILDLYDRRIVSYIIRDRNDNPLVFDTLYATSSKNNTPELTPSPFDKNRDGLVIGEGAGTLILEEYEHAKARGAEIYAEIAGFAANTDGTHITNPSRFLSNGEGVSSGVLFLLLVA